MDTAGIIDVKVRVTREPVPQPAPEGEPWECHPLAHWPTYELCVGVGGRDYVLLGWKACGLCSAQDAEYMGLRFYWRGGWLDSPRDADANGTPRAEVRDDGRLVLRSGHNLDTQDIEVEVTGDEDELEALAARINAAIEEAVPAARRPVSTSSDAD